MSILEQYLYLYSLDIGHTVGGVVIGAAILLGIIIFIFACCTSGDTRSNVYSGWKSRFCGKFVSSFVSASNFVIFKQCHVSLK